MKTEASFDCVPKDKHYQKIVYKTFRTHGKTGRFSHSAMERLVESKIKAVQSGIESGELSKDYEIAVEALRDLYQDI